MKLSSASLVKASRGGDGSVVVDPLSAVDGPVVVAVVVHVPVPVEHQTVLTRLLSQGTYIHLIKSFFLYHVYMKKKMDRACVHEQLLVLMRFP